MKYHAQHNCPRAYYAALGDVAEWISKDDHYRDSCPSSDWGCTGEMSLDSKPIRITHADLKGVVIARWRTCNDNMVEFIFDHDAQTVEIRVDSRRHGIPQNSFNGDCDWQTPDEVYQYETGEPQWLWFQTADDYDPSALLSNAKAILRYAQRDVDRLITDSPT